jgi:hypothetical protein
MKFSDKTKSLLINPSLSTDATPDDAKIWVLPGPETCPCSWMDRAGVFVVSLWLGNVGKPIFLGLFVYKLATFYCQLRLPEGTSELSQNISEWKCKHRKPWKKICRRSLDSVDKSSQEFFCGVLDMKSEHIYPGKIEFLIRHF